MLAIVMAPRAGAQSSGEQQSLGEAPPVTLKITVSISRWDGEKRISNAPYVLMAVPSYGKRAEAGVDGDSTSMQIGSQVPMPTVTKEGNRSWDYRSIGTNISVAARPLAGGQFNVYVSVTDSQLEATQPQAPAPRVQEFRASNRLALRDGQTVQYTVATDAISGQVTKLDVTMNVIK
jgi:hypothetical protein